VPVVVSSLALAIATLGFTLFGEALRDAVDPASGRSADDEAEVTSPLVSIRKLVLDATTARGTAHILRGIDPRHREEAASSVSSANRVPANRA
jgi:hypothetical protein